MQNKPGSSREEPSKPKNSNIAAQRRCLKFTDRPVCKKDCPYCSDEDDSDDYVPLRKPKSKSQAYYAFFNKKKPEATGQAQAGEPVPELEPNPQEAAAAVNEVSYEPASIGRAAYFGCLEKKRPGKEPRL